MMPLSIPTSNGLPRPRSGANAFGPSVVGLQMDWKSERWTCCGSWMPRVLVAVEIPPGLCINRLRPAPEKPLPYDRKPHGCPNPIFCVTHTVPPRAMRYANTYDTRHQKTWSLRLTTFHLQTRCLKTMNLETQLIPRKPQWMEVKLHSSFVGISPCGIKPFLADMCTPNSHATSTKTSLLEESPCEDLLSQLPLI